MPEISFRPLARDDLPLLHRWLNEPHVARWYYNYDGEPQTPENIAAKYAPRIDGTDPTRAFIIEIDGHPAGYIQAYRIGDWEPYAGAVGVDEVAAGVDLYIGEPDLAHRGLGSRIIERFLDDIVFADAEIQSCIIGPEPKNVTAIRAYEKAGFTYLKTVQVPGEPEPQHLMRRRRP